MTVYLVLSALISSLIPLLATTKASVCFYSMYASAQFIDTISMIPNNINKKINIHFTDFSSAGHSLQLVTTDSQISYHNFSFRFLSLYPFKFFLYKGGLLSISHINVSTSSTLDIAVWRYAQCLCTLLQLASNCLVASARGQAETCASCRYRQQFRCLESGSGCNF